MKTAPSSSFRSSSTRRSLRVILSAAALITLLFSGCAGMPASGPIAQTATVSGRSGTGSLDYRGTVSPCEPGTVPQKIICHSRAEAQLIGNLRARETGATLLITSGTPSMEPLIRGQAYVLIQYLPYDTITKGDLLVYQGRPNAAKADRVCMLHRAVMMDKGGWLMCGDNNRWTEAWDRVTPVTYLGTVTTILEFPQA